MDKTISLIILSVLVNYARSCNKTNHEVNYFCVNCRRTCQTAVKNDTDEPIMGCGCENGFIMDERMNVCLALNEAPKECNVTTEDFNFGFIFNDMNDNATEETGKSLVRKSENESTIDSTTSSNTDDDDDDAETVTESPLQSTTEGGIDDTNTTGTDVVDTTDEYTEDEDNGSQDEDDDGDDNEQSDEDESDSENNDDKDNTKH